MSRPTALAMEHVKHFASYLWGKWVPHMRDAHEVEERGIHLTEIILNADLTSDQATNHRTFHRRGRVDCDRHRHEWRYAVEKVGEVPNQKGCGHDRQKWLEWCKRPWATPRYRQSEAHRCINVLGAAETRATPTAISTADIGTQVLSRARLLGLMYMIQMVNAYNELVGKEEYEEISDKLGWEKSARMNTRNPENMGHVAMVLAMASPGNARGEDADETEGKDYTILHTLVITVMLATVLATWVLSWAWSSVKKFLTWLIEEEQPKKNAKETKVQLDHHEHYQYGSWNVNLRMQQQSCPTKKTAWRFRTQRSKTWNMATSFKKVCCMMQS